MPPDSSNDNPTSDPADPDATLAMEGRTDRLPGIERPGDMIGRYRLIEPLGQGGFGSVWRAEQHEPIHREVALKVIKAGMDTVEIIARFEAERQALALMDHPNIAAVLDAGTTESGRPFFVMELVKGVPVTRYCDEHHLTIRQRLQLFIPVCQAVQHAHQKSILHRDLKPSNILVMEVDGGAMPKVIDFGIAKALDLTAEPVLHAELAQTLEGMVLGTPLYMSPEQAGSEVDLDTRSDIYSLGAVLYELLTGSPPLNPESLHRAALEEVLRRIRDEDPPRASSRLMPVSEATRETAKARGEEPAHLSRTLRGDLDWILGKALEKDRSRRYSSAGAFAEDIGRQLRNEPVEAGPPSLTYRVGKFLRRNRIAAGAVSAVSLSLLIGTWASLHQAMRAEREKITAEQRERETNEALQQTRRTLSESYYLQAQEHRSKDRAAEAVAYLTIALRVDPEHDMARSTLLSILTQRSWPLRVARGITKVEGEIAFGYVPAKKEAKPTHGVFDIKSGRLQRELSVRHGGEQILSPEGDRFFSKDQLWDLTSGNPLGKSIDHVISARFSPDGKRLLLFTEEDWKKFARFYDADTGLPLGDRLAAPSNFNGAKFSISGTLLINGYGNQLYLWQGDFKSPPLKLEPAAHHGQISPDSRRIFAISADPDNPCLLAWDIDTGRPVPVPDPNLRVDEFCFSDDQECLILKEETGTLHIWEIDTGRKRSIQSDGHFELDRLSCDARFAFDSPNIRKLETAEVVSQVKSGSIGDRYVSFSRDGSQLLTSSWEDNSARIWDVASGAPITEPMLHYGRVEAEFCASDSRVTGDNDGDITLWNPQAGRYTGRSLAHSADVTSAEFSPSGQLVLTASTDGMARLWNPSTGEPAGPPKGHSSAVTSARFDADGTRVITATEEGKAFVWEVDSGRDLFPPLLHGAAIRSAQFCPDNRAIVTFSDNEVRFWNATTGQALSSNGSDFSLHFEGPINRIRFSPDGRRLLVCLHAGMGSLWDTSTGALLDHVGHFDGSAGSDGAAFSPDNQWLATIEYKGPTATLWKLNGDALELAGETYVDNTSSAIRLSRPSFSPDSTRLVTAAHYYRSSSSGETAARVWEVSTGQPVSAPMVHGEEILSVEFSQDGRFIATASVDQTSRVWDARTGLPISEPFVHPAEVIIARFSPAGDKLLTVAGDQAFLWDLPQTDEALPDWFLRFIEHLCGFRINESGTRVISASPFPIQSELEKMIPPSTGGYPASLARWLLMQREERPISPPLERESSGSEF